MTPKQVLPLPLNPPLNIICDLHPWTHLWLAPDTLISEFIGCEVYLQICVKSLDFLWLEQGTFAIENDRKSLLKILSVKFFGPLPNKQTSHYGTSEISHDLDLLLWTSSSRPPPQGLLLWLLPLISWWRITEGGREGRTSQNSSLLVAVDAFQMCKKKEISKRNRKEK